jgi:hypothetical protein
MTFRINQEKAIQVSIKNNFKSGVHFHAKGTGKSWIGLQLIIEHNKQYHNNII